MKYFVNENCIGCGLCAATCLKVFAMSDDGVAVAIETEVPEGALDAAALKRSKRHKIYYNLYSEPQTKTSLRLRLL